MKGMETGDAVVTVTSVSDNTKSATCNVTVTEPIKVQQITFDTVESTVAEEGILWFNVTVSPSDATNKEVEWSSSDSSILKVSKLGMITGVKEGQADVIVTATDGSGVSVSQTITVVHRHVHMIWTWAKAAKCEEKGNIEYFTCRCGKIFSDDEGKNEITKAETETEALGHEPGENITENDTPASCTKIGGYDLVKKCTRCGIVINKTHVVRPSLGHEWSDWTITKEAEEGTDGERYRTCSRCGATETEIIPAPGHQHDMHAVAENPRTCTENGTKAHWECATCHNFFEDEQGTKQVTSDGLVIPAEGHKPDKPVCEKDTPATCTKARRYVMVTYCTVCKNEIDRIEVPEGEALGHDWSDWKVKEPATYTEDGIATRFCKRDGCEQTETGVIPRTGPSGGGASEPTEDQKAADDVAALIKVLPEEINLDNEDAVKEAEDAYNALTDKQKTLVDVALVEKLNKAGQTISDWKDFEDASAKAGQAQFNNFKVKARKHKKAIVTILSQGTDQTLQLRYSRSKKFKVKATKLVTLKEGQTTVKIKKLKPKKKYFFQIRPVSEVTNKATGETTEINGQWSEAKKIKAKK